MARFVISKLDHFINYLTLSFTICGGMIIHILTALTIQSYYGSPWGYLAFALPGLSELYLCTIQISESMYNYMIMLTIFLTVTGTLGLTCFLKNLVRSRVKEAVES